MQDETWLRGAATDDGGSLNSGFSDIVAVDGASGSGKTSVLRAVATAFECTAVELGPVVRAVAWLADRDRVGLVDAVARLASLESVGRFAIDVPSSSPLAASEVRLDYQPLRSETFGNSLADAIAAASLDVDVMKWVHSLVRESIRGRKVILSAREAAVAVCPDAGLKIRLEANPEVRAQRKRLQMLACGLTPVWLDDVQLLGPSASDVTIDTTCLSEAEVAEQVIRLAHRSLGWPVSLVGLTTPAVNTALRAMNREGLASAAVASQSGLAVARVGENGTPRTARWALRALASRNASTTLPWWRPRSRDVATQAYRR